MELIVKIGADNQGLQQAIDRIKTQFHNLNQSLPSSWAGNAAGMSKYGSILQSGGGSPASSLSGIPIIGDLAHKFEGLLGPVGLVGAGLAGLALIIKETGSAIGMAAKDMRTGRITGMSGLMARRWRQAGDAAGVEGEAGASMVNRLNANVGAFNAGDSSAQKLFGELGINPSGMSTDDLLVAIKGKMGGMKDPAARARMAKGLFGRGGFEVSEVFAKLDAPGLADTEGMDLAAASGIKKWFNAIKRQVGEAAEMIFTKAAGTLAKSRLAAFLGIKPGQELQSGVAGEEFGDVKAEVAASETAEEKEKRYRAWAAGKTTIKKRKPMTEARNSPIGFQADQLAQAGLFAGFSLLMNPNMTVMRDQLEVLRKIESNTGKAKGIFQ